MPNGDGAAVRGHRQQHHHRRQSRLESRSPPQPGARLAQLFQERAGRATTTSRSAARSSARRPSTSGSTAIPATSSTASNNGVPTDVYLFEPGEGIVGLWTYAGFVNDTWRLNNRMTMNLGLRWDRYSGFLPEQEHPVSRFNPTAITFAAQDGVFNWNLFVAARRLHLRHARQRQDGREAELRPVLVESGRRLPLQRQLATSTADGTSAIAGPTRTAIGVWDPGEQGALVVDERRRGHRIARSRISRTPTRASWPAGSSASCSPTSACAPGSSGVASGSATSASTRSSRSTNFTVPVTIPDRGPDNVAGTADDGPTIQGFNLAPAVRRARRATCRRTCRLRQRLLHVGDHGHEAVQQSMVAARDVRPHLGEGILERLLRQHRAAEQPAGDAERRDQHGRRPAGIHDVAGQTARHLGIAVVGHQAHAILRHQSGQPYGRIFQFAFNYGTQRVLAEPLGTRRQDNITLLDVRVEKAIRFGARVASPASSTCSTCSTATPSRTSPGHRARRSCVRRTSCRRASRGSAPSSNGDSAGDGSRSATGIGGQGSGTASGTFLIPDSWLLTPVPARRPPAAPRNQRRSSRRSSCPWRPTAS